MLTKHQSLDSRELDALHHLHPFTNHRSLRADGVRVIVRGEGPYIFDSEGKRILDGMAGLWTCNIGYGRKELAETAYEQILELPFYNTFFKTTHPPVAALAQKLAQLAPGSLNQVFFGSSGSEANDTAICLMRHYWALKGEPKRRIIISRRMAYHGSTIAAGSMGGMPHVHEHSYPVYEGFRHIIDPYWYGEGRDGESLEEFGLRAAKALEDEILAVRFALAGRWAHIPQVLARRSWHQEPVPLTQKLLVPNWQARFSNALQVRELLRHVDETPLTVAQRARIRNGVEHAAIHDIHRHRPVTVDLQRRIELGHERRHVGDGYAHALAAPAFSHHVHGAAGHVEAKLCFGLLHRHDARLQQYGRDAHRVGARHRRILRRLHDDGAAGAVRTC